MPRNKTLIHRLGEMTTTGGTDVMVAAYTVPAGAVLGITDIKVMAVGVGAETLNFYLNEAVLGHLYRVHFPNPGSGIFSARFETPITFTPGQIVSILAVASAAGGNVAAAEWEGELLA